MESGAKERSQMVPKEPSWPRDTFGQKALTEGLASRLGTRGARILGILGWSGSPGMVWESWHGLGSWEILGPGRSWDLGDAEIWGNLGWRDGGPEVSIYTTPDPPPPAAVMLEDLFRKKR